MDRGNSFIGYRSSHLPNESEMGAVAIVDPFSTGAVLAASVSKAGYKCVRVLSEWDSPIASMVQSDFKSLEFCATIQYDDRKPDQDAATNEVSWRSY